jgi:hypothetical protein
MLPLPQIAHILIAMAKKVVLLLILIYVSDIPAQTKEVLLTQPVIYGAPQKLLA